MKSSIIKDRLIGLSTGRVLSQGKNIIDRNNEKQGPIIKNLALTLWSYLICDEIHPHYYLPTLLLFSSLKPQ
jgi:hypothetical protein